MDANTDGRPPRYVAPVTAEQLQAAVRILMRAWAPSTPLPGDEGYGQADDFYDPDDQCNCAGEDDDGNQLGCNCGGGCCCDNCQLYDWQRYKRCWSVEASGTHCHRATAYRVVSFRLVRLSLQDPSLARVCSHPAGTPCLCSAPVWIDAGVKEQRHQLRPACSVAHARLIQEEVRAYDERTYAHADPDDRPRYRIEPWTYVPHVLEQPAHLAALSTWTQDAVNDVLQAVQAEARGLRDVDWLRHAREALARAAWQAAQPVDAPDDEPDDFDEPPGPVMEEPPDSDGPWDPEPVAAEASAS